MKTGSRAGWALAHPVFEETVAAIHPPNHIDLSIALQIINSFHARNFTYTYFASSTLENWTRNIQLKALFGLFYYSISNAILILIP